MARYTYTLKDSPKVELGEIWASSDEEAIRIAKEAKAHTLFRNTFKDREVIEKIVLYTASVG